MSNIGIDYILEVYGVTKSYIAKKFGVPAPNVTGWAKKDRPIPQDKLEELYKMFPSIPRDYFTKELSRWEILDIQEIYLRETDVVDEYEIPHKEEDGRILVISQQSYQNEQSVLEIQAQKDHIKFIERIENLIEEDTGIRGINKEMLKDLIDILETGDKKSIAIMQMILLHLNTKRKWWGEHPAYRALKEQKEMYADFKQFLDKYGVIN
ncbi:hypothetical protein [Paenibacillus sp. J2TS4]|uniref:hypothetical protein n=1 Tax=Paenibacillus sp. J2TS4 TaxID=2807194 RepID=UPI001B0FBAB8|nr:hypothetical protein [Paenibacillus sp. J2TS4]GIP33046.1 hypothetical protein J2TS4_22560 [Paenibacillus sp. J2TS4]